MSFLGSAGIYTLIVVLIVICCVLWFFAKHVK